VPVPQHREVALGALGLPVAGDELSALGLFVAHAINTGLQLQKIYRFMEKKANKFCFISGDVLDLFQPDNVR
jgi:hypothetical protein